jgi:hypothetical protein
MAKKSGLVSFVKKAKRLKTESSSFMKKNPPIVTDVFTYIVPAAGAYVATRMIGRAARTFLGGKFPKTLPFAAPAASLATFGMIWYFAHKVDFTKKYHNQLMIGAGIAVIQSLVQSVLPGMNWLFDSAPIISLPPTNKVVAPTDGFDDLEFVDVDNTFDAGINDSPADVESVDGEDVGNFKWS